MTDITIPYLHLWAGILVLFVAYAEIHFKLAGFRGVLFKKEPEIIFDLPHRADSGKTIPLFLFIKDAHRYPVRLSKIQISIRRVGASQDTAIEEECPVQISQKFYSKVIELPAAAFPQGGEYEVLASLNYTMDGKQKELVQDNYRSIPHDAFKIYVSADALPTLPGWYWGDLHSHSNFTEDQVEFGAPIKDLITCAKCIGLHFLAVTDHSFDLENNYFSGKGSHHWKEFLSEAEIANGNSTNFVLLPGEEVSAGNRLKKNVHCLVLGSQQFYPGDGDGAKNLLRNRPTMSLRELLQKNGSGDNAVIAAAHPRDIPPRSQRLILNRGFWQREDLFDKSLDYWQILNGKIDRYFLEGLQLWKEALLDGFKIGIMAGNDSHGNFNCYRQIRTPLLKLNKHDKQLLGKMRSAVFIEGQFNKENLMEALKKKRLIISSGPALSLEAVQDGQRCHLGDTLKNAEPLSLKISAKSSAEFQPITEMVIYHGSYSSKQEQKIYSEVVNGSFYEERDVKLGGLTAGYLRAELLCGDTPWEFFCLTNPIWIE